MRNLISYSAVFEGGDLAVWFGLVWVVTNNNTVGVVSTLLVATALARIMVGLATSFWLRQLTLPKHLKNISFWYSIITLVMGLALLFNTSINTIIVVEIGRSILATIIRIQRETLFHFISKKNKSIAGYWVSITHTIRVIVPSIAGILIAYFSLPILCFVVGFIVGIYAILSNEKIKPEVESDVKATQLPKRKIHADVRLITIFMLFANAATAPLGIFLPAVFVYEFNVGIMSFGVAEGLLALGCIVGAFLSPSITKIKFLHLYSNALLQMVLYGLLWYLNGIIILYIILFLLGLCIGYVQSCILSSYLCLIPDALYGLIRSRQMALSGIAFSLSSAASGIIASNTSFQLIPLYQAAFWMGAFFILIINVRSRSFFCIEGNNYVES